MQHTYDGLFVVNRLPRDRLVLLRDPTGRRNCRRPVHKNRLKLAHLRPPSPAPYFNPQTEETDISSSKTEKEASSGEVETTNNTESRDSVSDMVLSNNNIANDETTNALSEHVRQTSVRPKRQVQKPLRYCDENHVNPDEVTRIIESSGNNQLKVKRILAKWKDCANFVYLIQQIGEPAQNAIWLPLSRLPPKAQTLCFKDILENLLLIY